MEDVRWPAKQLEEHRLEISNRIRNLFWTVSGDYDMEFEPDTEKYVYSKQTVLYEAVKQGAFARYFDQKKLGMYLMKKLHFSAGEDILLPLAGLCMDAAVERFIIRERLGTKEIREQAFRELEKAEEEQVSDKAGTDLIHRIRLLYIRHVLENTDDKGMDPQAEIALYKILSLKNAENTEDVINVIDEIYNHVLDPSFEKRNGNLEKILNLPDMALANDAWQECMTDEQMEDIIQKYLSNLKKKMMSLDIKNKKKKRLYFYPENEEVPESPENLNPQAVRRIREYVELNYGKSYLSESEQARVNRKFCTGIHKNCILYLTDGILQNPVIKNNQYRFSQLQFEKNKAYYGNNHWIIKRNISVLAESLKRAFIIRKDDSVSRSDAGQLVPVIKNNQYRFSQLQFEKNKAYYGNNHWIIKRNISVLAESLKRAFIIRKDDFVSRSDAGQLVPERLWKIGRTDDDKLFNRKKRSEDSEFVIDVLIDSSGSQAGRQAQVAAQGYIISEALSQAGIPHRVTGYCAFWGYTVLQRFRDYEDPRETNERIFQFRAYANNRDGLALKTVSSSLMERPEKNKILIVLSDGKPCDMSIQRPGTRQPKIYDGEKAVKDTAYEVRRARNQGIFVIGIFAGNEEELSVEKRIYGKDFAYIRNISNFSRIVGTFLRRQIDME